jgi:low temperature requirement protein LtrA
MPEQDSSDPPATLPAGELRTRRSISRRLVGDQKNTADRVTYSELFLDLVFAFLITRVAHVIEQDPSVTGVVHALLPLAVVWWMFNGFGWATNAVPPTGTLVRLLLVVAMIAFFIIGLDLPHVFDQGQALFAVCYLVVVLIHLVIFLGSSERGSRQAIGRTVPFNACAAALVLANVWIPRAWGWVAWVVAVSVLYLSPLFGHIRGFVLQPRHFIDRHAALFLIVLGESIGSIGIGLQNFPVGAGLVLGTVAGMSLAAATWWVYFDGDEESAEAAFERGNPARRQSLAFTAFTDAHLVMVVGIVLIASGIASAIPHPEATSNLHAIALGSALFLLGHGLFRFLLHSGSPWSRVIASVIVVVSAFVFPLGNIGEMIVGIGALTMVAVLDHMAILRREKNTYEKTSHVDENERLSSSTTCRDVSSIKSNNDVRLENEERRMNRVAD